MPLSDRGRRFAVPLILFLFGLVALGAAVALTLGRRAPNQGVAAVGGPFALVSHDGRAVTERDFHGAPYLVFFGFTHCPDICPTKLLEISEVLRAAGNKGRGLRALFVTVDPERDNPDVLKSYLASFDQRIVGLTGSREAVDAAVKVYRAFARKVPLKDGDYTMDHTSLVYHMDREGRFIGSFNLNRPATVAAQELVRSL